MAELCCLLLFLARKPKRRCPRHAQAPLDLLNEPIVFA